MDTANINIFDNLINQIEIINIVILSLIVLEILIDFFFYRNKRDFSESWIDIGMGIIFELSSRLGGLLISFAILSFSSQFALIKLSNNYQNLLLAILIYDFIYYWTHRLEHSSRLFWTWHSVHHSSPEYSLSTSLRLSWLEPFILWYTLIPLVLIGFQPTLVMLAAEISLLYQFFLHTKKIKKLGFLELIFNTPSNHRVHHGSNNKYLDKNYGSILIIWDRLFGTYQKEEEKVIYGLTKPINSKNPLVINITELARTWKGFMRNENLYKKALWLFSRPQDSNLLI
jgi:sterol desaturase/sphingolipid hydroxylase (fatty acid hydroxylase superfamily)